MPRPCGLAALRPWSYPQQAQAKEEKEARGNVVGVDAGDERGQGAEVGRQHRHDAQREHGGRKNGQARVPVCEAGQQAEGASAS